MDRLVRIARWFIDLDDRRVNYRHIITYANCKSIYLGFHVYAPESCLVEVDFDQLS